MIRFSTLNIQRAGAAKVHLLADLMHDDEAPVDVLAVQELDLDVASAASFIDCLRRRDLHVFLSGLDGGLYRCAVLAKIAGAAVDLQDVRLAGAVFEFLCRGSYVKVVVASLYGCVWNPDVAMQAAENAVQELKRTQTALVLLGDFNLDPADDPMAAKLAAGFAWAWDDAFQGEEPLPGTRASGRRLDYALGCGRFFPAAVSQRWTFSDHAQVTYTVDLQDCAGFRGPAFRELLHEDVPENQWIAAWDSEAFDRAISQEALDEAWTLLSDTAEDLLAAQGARGHRRSEAWCPRARAPVRSRAARSLESLLVVQLRRLWRRLLQLRRRPGDQHLRDKIGHQLCAMIPRVPWLSDLPYFEMESWCDWLAERIDEEEHAQKARAIAKWRERMNASETQVCAWVRRRSQLNVELERPVMQADSVVERKAVHPVHVVEEAEVTWMKRWGQSQCTGLVSQLLTVHPELPEFGWEPEITAAGLRRSARAMAHKAAGPHGWACEASGYLPLGFWTAFARLWRAVVQSGIVPCRWREGRVVMIEKPTSGQRPLTILSCAWRVGARLLVRQLGDWIQQWASLRVLGGVSRCGLKDAYLRIIDALDDDQLYIQEDLTKFFDSIRLGDLLCTMRRLGAPVALCTLVQSFYGDHRRVFSYAGMVGSRWWDIRCGVAQGCPLSPVLAATVMVIWSAMVEDTTSRSVASMSFVDDRLLWAKTVRALRLAKARSDRFDMAYGFTCDVGKSRFVHASASMEAVEFGAELGYEVSDTLSLLGLAVPLNKAIAPSLKDFELRKVLRCIRLVGVAATGMAFKQRLLNVLALPQITWAGGFASVNEAIMEELMGAFRYVLHKDLAADTPPLLCYEMAGWTCHPGFARELAALREAIRVHSRDPVWVEDASIRLAAKRWPSLLPFTVEVLDRLGWWHDPGGRFFYRRDSLDRVRRFELGIDSVEVLIEWLQDVHRRRGLLRCGRVVHSLHRAAGDVPLAQGLALPAPLPGTLATFEGHKWAWKNSVDTLERRSALVTGCSVWHKHKRLRDHGQDPPPCLCGGHLPSRPHLLWCCERTADLRAAVLQPSNRLEERLLARGVPETPTPPGVVDYEDYIDELAAGLQTRLASRAEIFVATNGSVVDNVSAWAVALDDEGGYALGVAAEDQTPHRAEVEGLMAVLAALLRCEAAGVVHVLADCQSAIETIRGGGQAPLLSARAVMFQEQLRGRITLRLWWVPSHGKLAPTGWQCPPCGEMRARALNARADRLARERATRRAAGSDRQACVQARRAAFQWEKSALLALRQVARRWAEA